MRNLLVLLCLVMLGPLGCDNEATDVDASTVDQMVLDGAAGDTGRPDSTSPPVDAAPPIDGGQGVDVAVGDMAPVEPDGGPPVVDAGPVVDMSPSMGDGCEAMPIIEQRCSQGGCHLPHNPRTSLVLTREAMEAGGLRGYVVPGDPGASFLVDRMRGVGPGPLMPLGAVSPIAELPLIEAWIADGAPTHCDTPSLSPPMDPNHLDPEALFVCDGPQPGTTPARIRRVERREWTRSVVKPLAGTWWGSTAKDNPFAAPDRLPYSTYPADVTIDEATLDLYMLVLPEAPALWTARDPRQAPGFIPGVRTEVGYNNRALRCIFNDAEPDDACIDLYIGTLLRDGVLFRTPTADEHDRLRALLVQALADEAAQGERRATLQFVGEAAFLMSGALFRSEVGVPAELAPGDAPRNRLTADELALAVGRVLSAHPVGAPLPLDAAALPDADTPLMGRLGLIRAAAEDGSIFDPDVVSALLEAYRGGVDPERLDLIGEEDARGIPSRGEYWLAENLRQFFREWLDYEGGNTAFKDAPGATSLWDGTFPGDPMYDPSTTGYRRLQSGAPGHEPTFVEQLDDTIARAVVESHQQGEDVFAKLMTTRLWRLPSNRADVNDVPCDDNADCVDATFDRCTAAGVCGNSIASGTLNITRVFGLEGDVQATPEGRWVEMPEGDRAGVLTHPAWLAAHGRNFEDDASAVHRGLWIRERLFCESVPGLELVQAEAQLIPSDPAHSARERLRRSVEDPDLNPQSQICMGCHVLMNSLGYPFEIYNHAGYMRAFDHGVGGPEPPSGYTRIQVPPEQGLDREFADATEFVEALAVSRVARRCFVRQAFRYFAGRDETPADACVLSEMEAALDRSGSFFDMLDVLVASGAFQDRVPPEVQR